MAFQKIMPVDELWQGDMIGCEIEGTKVLLVRIDETIYAYEDRCAHLGVAISEGLLQDDVLTCCAHFYSYDARTGQGINPRSVCLRPFDVKIVDGNILVDIPPNPPGTHHEANT